VGVAELGGGRGPPLQVEMKISKAARRDAKRLFRSCLADGLLDEKRVRQFVQEIGAGKPRGYLEILSHFCRLVQLDVELHTARVESVTALPPAMQARVNEQLNRLYGAGLDIAFAEDRALIGGLRIKSGNDVYDGSVRARLNALAESF
jgi:F-type H+-transporting ATPase subunit delta